MYFSYFCSLKNKKQQKPSNYNIILPLVEQFLQNAFFFAIANVTV